MRFLLALFLALPAYAQDVPDESDSTEDDGARDAEEPVGDTGISEPEPEPEPEYVIRFKGQVTPDNKHFDLEQLYADNKFKEGLTAAKLKLKGDPSDADLSWHITRFMFEIAETFDRNDGSIDKEGHYVEMLAVANAGLENAPNDPHIRFARGVAAGRLGTTRGVLSSLWSAKGIEQDWLYTANSGFTYAAINGAEQLPCDSYHALGIFYRLVPDSFIVQMLAGTRGSLTKSIDYLDKANRGCPNRMATMKELAVSKMCKAGKKDEAMLNDGKDLIKAYLKLPAEDEKDRLDHKHGKTLLATPEIACGYSRDGQQDLDTKKLEK